MTGKTIGQYTILEKIGEGGMGVVYKAHDAKLDRVVALKFLPDRLRTSEQDKARFTQEARAAATITHPNVCVIHDIHEDADQMFMVMEYVDGATLRTKNPVASLPEAIGYAVQIGEALGAAHDKGIVHRDIKADNIMIASTGHVKVMDFGLAKIKGTMKLTRTSSTVGTLAYMAPEQISGGEVDARSDIFSFGVVLYEMLAGRTPFRGDHEAAMVYSIVNEEPEPIDKYRADLPSELHHVLARALEKDPAERYQSVDEMVIDLRRLKKESTKVSRAHPVRPTAAPPAAPASGRGKIVALIAFGLLVLAVAAYVLFLRKPSAEGAALTLNPSMTLRVLQIPLSEASYPGMSSDGNWISFPAGDRNGRWDIYYMHTASSEPKRVTHDSATFSQQVSDISPDGSQIAYTQVEPATGERSLYVIASLGGVGRRIALRAGNVRWRPDAQRLGFERIVQSGNQLWSVRPDGTDERLEFTDSSAAGRYSFAYSPDGGSVAWIRSFPDYYQEVFTHDLATGAERQLTFDKKNVDDVCWLRNGMILYSSNKSGNTNLWVVPAAGGASQQVTKGSGPDIGITASWDGKKVLYLQQQPIATVWITDTKGGEPQQLTFDDRNITGVDISPDRSQIVFIMADPDPIKKAAQIVVQDRATGNRVVVASDAITTSSVVWSPDGKWIAYGTFSPGQPQDSVRIQLVDPRHPGPPRLLHNGFPIYWVSDTTLAIGRPGLRHVELLSIVSGALQGLGVDSTFVFPVANGSRYLLFDNRPPAGAYLADEPAPGAARSLIADFSAFSVNNDSVFLFRTKAKEWFAYDFRTRKRERIAAISMGNSPNFNASLSRDAAEIVYTVGKQSGKLVMIENMFQ